MRKTLSYTFLLLTGLLGISGSVLAHHGTAAFETSKSVTMKTTVADWYWANPHCFLKFDYKK